MHSHISELFKQSNDIRNQIIQNFDNQVLHIRGIFGTIISAFIGSTIVIQQKYLLIGAVAVSTLFWIVETSIKKNQRGYILISNEIQKAMCNSKSDEEIQEVIKKFHSDMNGFYSIRKENFKYYKKLTGFLHTMFMPNVFSLYLLVIFLSVGIFILCSFK